MTSLQLPKISLNNIRQLKINEKGIIIIPIDLPKDYVFYEKQTTNSWCIFNFHKKGVKYHGGIDAPLVPNEKFYISEEFIDTTQLVDKTYTGISRYLYNEMFIKDIKPIPASKMTSEQSRFHGICIDIKLHKMEHCYPITLYKITPKEYKELVFQHNKLYQTNIEPSLDDYVFYVTIKRIK